jgi:cytochrome c5
MRRAAVSALALAAAGAGHPATLGEKVYERTCTVCHGDGLSGAPRLGNRAEWAARVPKGTEALVESVKNGKGLMPPRGGNAKFTDEELRAAVEYMISRVR